MDKKQFTELKGILNQISSKLNILIYPQFKRDKKWQDKKITGANIKRLKDCGIDYKEIADILDMKPGTVANELTYLKQKTKIKNVKK